MKGCSVLVCLFLLCSAIPPTLAQDNNDGLDDGLNRREIMVLVVGFLTIGGVGLFCCIFLKPGASPEEPVKTRDIVYQTSDVVVPVPPLVQPPVEQYEPQEPAHVQHVQHPPSPQQAPMEYPYWGSMGMPAMGNMGYPGMGYPGMGMPGMEMQGMGMGMGMPGMGMTPAPSMPGMGMTQVQWGCIQASHDRMVAVICGGLVTGMLERAQQ
eukprot:CAMPEP_0177692466 /NCGR_PEP_ID=MMETSP0484_2-20121128/1866_1 /TAXON_ID=354590 /ORGANISM="Rhodomonas lens, Strain RHODO" /LENGTH=209 /DNA_ID=CAMNT_0019203181 /DNA_START=81 /DNA_END=708 /DNA_ORIENTATION=+